MLRHGVHGSERDTEEGGCKRRREAESVPVRHLGADSAVVQPQRVGLTHGSKQDDAFQSGAGVLLEVVEGEASGVRGAEQVDVGRQAGRFLRMRRATKSARR